MNVVDIATPIRRFVRRALLRAVHAAIEDGTMHGFALVSWDKTGCSTISYETKYGVIRRRMLPEHVKAAIQGYILTDDVGYHYKLGDNDE
jgi:hypothetical protein